MLKNDLPEIVNHLLYGDIDEMPLDILGKECPTQEDYMKFNGEINARFQAAATILAWKQGRLHRGGYLFNPEIHKKEDSVS